MTIALALYAFTSLLVPGFGVRVVAPALGLAFETVTVVVALAVASLSWVRFHQTGRPIALFQTAAFLIVAAGNGARVAIQVLGLDLRAGIGLSAPSQAHLYIFTISRLLPAVLLVVGAIASLRGWHVAHPSAIVVGSVAVMLLAILLGAAAGNWLPGLSTVGGPTTSNSGSTTLPSSTILGAGVQLMGAALFLWAAELCRRLPHAFVSVSNQYLAVGLVFAAFSQVEFAVHPDAHVGLVTTGDLMRLAFDLILLLGIQAEAAAVLASLRVANVDLRRLGAVEADRAALQERARLARELHDGLAQDLWVAKLKIGRLEAMTDLGLEAQALSEELARAIDAGLANAQQAVAALRLSDEDSGPLRDLLPRMVAEFSDRFGLRAELECEQDLPSLSPRQQAEVLLITHEALTNVRRHADATLIRVHAGIEAGHLLLIVSDNGRGFSPDAIGTGAYGLASMHERAALIGGQLRIDSSPNDGTRVSLLVALAMSPAPVGGT